MSLPCEGRTVGSGGSKCRNKEALDGWIQVNLSALVPQANDKHAYFYVIDWKQEGTGQHNYHMRKFKLEPSPAELCLALCQVCHPRNV